MHGQVAWISGGGQGIGLDLGKVLVSKGFKVALVDVCSLEKGQAAVDACGGNAAATFLRCDVTDSNALRDSLQKAADAFRVECVSVFVNNAGIVDEARMSQMIDINVKAVIEGCVVQEEMLRSAGIQGVIVNTASMAGLVPSGMTPAYDASKFACVGWTLSFARKLEMQAAQKAVPLVRVNCVCPHLIDTPDVGLYFRNAWETLGGRWAKMAKQPMPPRVVVAAMMQLIEDNFHGAVAIVAPKGSWIYKPDVQAVLTPQGTPLARM